jgi:O-antigen/teichoic acid export membrane protein
MASSGSVLLRGAVWNTGSFIFSQAMRFATNVVLTRLLAPDLFGAMMIVNTLRSGIELVSDIGVGPNIVSSPNADNPKYYNTVFTFQALRGTLVWLLLIACAAPMAAFYNLKVLIWIVPITGMATFFSGLTSLSKDFLKKKLKFAQLGVFELVVSALSSLVYIVLALIWPNIWSLAIGGVLGSFIFMVGTYFLRADLHLRFRVAREYVSEILHYGKWIFLSSIVYFLSGNYDRLFLAKVVPLHTLGIYGLARSIAELVGLLVGRLGGNVLFPFIASHNEMPREALRRQLAPMRLRFLALSAVGLAIVVSGSDLVISFVYDRRYHEAMWMLPVLVLGSWFSILASLNESALLGFGRPFYSAASNTSKFIFVIIFLPLGTATQGLLGGVLVVAIADLPKVLALQVGLNRQRFSFAAQDVLMTLATAGLIVALEVARWSLGLGTSFDTVPALGVSLRF